MDEFTGDRPAPPPLPILPDDLLLEIFQRLPPEPIYLFRASVVSKHWRSLVHDAGFLRRFRKFHGGTPPVLGFLKNQPGPSLFVPTTANAFVASTAHRMFHEDWRVLDCRHGLALLRNSYIPWVMLVWDLATGDQRYLPMPPTRTREGSWNGAVLRAASHGDCHSRPFLAVYVFSSRNDVTCACVYSSETGVWSEIASTTVSYLIVDVRPTALVGNILYWLTKYRTILEVDLDNHRLGLIETIPYDNLRSYDWDIIIMPTENGLLGFAGVEGFNLHLWSMVKSIDKEVTWTRQRVIDLKKLLSPEVVATCTVRVKPIGFAEEAGVIFIRVYSSVYMVHLKSMQIDEVREKGTYGRIFPYASFYSPGITIHGGHDQTELLNNS